MNLQTTFFGVPILPALVTEHRSGVIIPCFASRPTKVDVVGNYCSGDGQNNSGTVHQLTFGIFLLDAADAADSLTTKLFQEVVVTQIHTVMVTNNTFPFV